MRIGLRIPGAELFKPYAPELGEAVYISALLRAPDKRREVLGLLPVICALFLLLLFWSVRFLSGQVIDIVLNIKGIAGSNIKEVFRPGEEILGKDFSEDGS